MLVLYKQRGEAVKGHKGSALFISVLVKRRAESGDDLAALRVAGDDGRAVLAAKHLARVGIRNLRVCADCRRRRLVPEHVLYCLGTCVLGSTDDEHEQP